MFMLSAVLMLVCDVWSLDVSMWRVTCGVLMVHNFILIIWKMFDFLPLWTFVAYNISLMYSKMYQLYVLTDKL